MFTTQFELVLVVVAFLLGTFVGPLLWIWFKQWFWAEATAIENKITGHSGPTGHTGP